MRRAILTAAAWGLLFIGCSAQPSEGRPEASGQAPSVVTEPPRPRLLVVHSYHSGYEWTAGIQRGIERALSKADHVEVGVYYMDTKRQASEPYKVQAGQLARDITEEWKPDVVVTSDDNAQAYFAKYLAGRDDVKVVFCGVNAEPDRYGFPAANVTGLLERSPVAEAVATLDAVAPGRRRLALLADASPTSDGGFTHFRNQAEHARVVAYAQPETLAEWKRAVRRLAKKADAIGFYTYHTVRGPDGANVNPRELMAWTTQTLEIPTFSLFSFGVDDGALLGYVGSSYETGLKSGTWALEILNGQPIERFPITSEVKGQSMINLDTARALGLDISPETAAGFDVRVEGAKDHG